jgi:hypothetical protein
MREGEIHHETSGCMAMMTVSGVEKLQRKFHRIITEKMHPLAIQYYCQE